MKFLGSALLCLFAGACALLASSNNDNEQEKRAEKELAKFLDLSQVDGAIQVLMRNIQLGWEKESQKWANSIRGDKRAQTEESEDEEASFIVVALNELRKFKHEMELEQARYNEIVMRRQLAEEKRQLARAKMVVEQQQQQQHEFQGDSGGRAGTQEIQNMGAKGLVGSVFKKVSNSLGDMFNQAKETRAKGLHLDDYILNSAEDEQAPSGEAGNPVKPLDEEEAEQLRQAQTYSQYLKYVQRHNEKLKTQQLESMKVRTKDFVKSLFVEEAKDLAFLLLQQLITEKKVNLKQEMVKQLLWKIQMNLFMYLCGLLADVLAYVFGRKVLPKVAEEENPMNWMLYQMID